MAAGAFTRSRIRLRSQQAQRLFPRLGEIAYVEQMPLQAMDAGTAQLQPNLRTAATENEGDAQAAVIHQHVLQRCQGRHVQHWHRADVDDHYLDLGIEAPQRSQSLSAAPRTAARGSRRWPHARACPGGCAAAPGKGGGVGQLAHALDEQPGRQQQPDAYRQHHVEQHGEDQAGQQHQHVAARGDAQHVHHVRCFAHVPATITSNAASAAIGR